MSTRTRRCNAGYEHSRHPWPEGSDDPYQCPGVSGSLFANHRGMGPTIPLPGDPDYVEVQPEEDQPGTAGGRVDPETVMAAMGDLPPGQGSYSLAKAQAQSMGLARALLGRIVVGWSMCELADQRGFDRCKAPVAAARFEDGFLDLVCEDHAVSAEERGALVVRL